MDSNTKKQKADRQPNIIEAALHRRALVTDDSVPLLPTYVRLQWEPVRGVYALLSPEKVFWPNDIGGEILKLCTGDKTVAAIGAILAAEYDAPVSAVLEDVTAFLQEWADQLLVKI